MISACEPPSAWQARLPDLVSRYRALLSFVLWAPDDALLASVLVKHFGDRQLRVAPGVFAYLVPRIERSFAAAASLAARLDKRALETGRPVTIKLARDVLAEEQGAP